MIVSSGCAEVCKPDANANSEPADQYLRTFQWNKVKYRADKPIGELMDSLQKVCLKKWIFHDES